MRSRLALALIVLSACKENTVELRDNPAIGVLNEALPMGAMPLSDLVVDPNARIEVHATTSIVVPGNEWVVAVDVFVREPSALLGVGVRFGDRGALAVITSSVGVGERLRIPIRAEICRGLGAPEPDPANNGNWSWAPPRGDDACHTLRAELYAVTTDRKVSEAATIDVALKCPAIDPCAQPSCSAILAECKACAPGRWEGSWDAILSSGPLAIAMREEGGRIIGPLSIGGESAAGCGLSGGELEGSVANNQITFGTVSAGEGGETIQFDGTIDFRCTEMRGSFEIGSGRCMGNDGTWVMRKVEGEPARPTPQGMGSSDDAGVASQPAPEDAGVAGDLCAGSFIIQCEDVLPCGSCPERQGPRFEVMIEADTVYVGPPFDVRVPIQPEGCGITIPYDVGDACTGLVMDNNLSLLPGGSGLFFTGCDDGVSCTPRCEPTRCDVLPGP